MALSSEGTFGVELWQLKHNSLFSNLKVGEPFFPWPVWQTEQPAGFFVLSIWVPKIANTGRGMVRIKIIDNIIFFEYLINAAPMDRPHGIEDKGDYNYSRARDPEDLSYTSKTL